MTPKTKLLSPLTIIAIATLLYTEGMRILTFLTSYFQIK